MPASPPSESVAAEVAEPPPLDAERPAPRSSARSAARAYSPTFWLCFLANTLAMVGVSLMFRYDDFVHVLGGAERQLGTIVGVGMLGALGMRWFQTFGIDHFGARAVWLASLTSLTGSLLMHLLIERLDGPAIFVARMLYMMGLAGTFGASLTFVTLIAPPARMAEMVGMLGSSGFIGMATGPVLGDLIVGRDPSRADVNRMFQVAAAMTGASLAAAIVATWRAERPRPAKRSPRLGVMRRFHPGTLLFVAAALGIGLSLPNVFLRAYARELGINSISPFFLTYAASAFLMRVLFRRLVDDVGERPVIFAGMACLTSSMLLYLVVRSPYLLPVPAVLAGTAHAFLFPAVVAGGTTSFPVRYRGLATTLVLAMFDLGGAFGQPLVGLIIDVARGAGLPGYPVMFCGMAGLLTLAALPYWLIPPRRLRRRSRLR